MTVKQAASAVLLLRTSNTQRSPRQPVAGLICSTVVLPSPLALGSCRAYRRPVSMMAYVATVWQLLLGTPSKSSSRCTRRWKASSRTASARPRRPVRGDASAPSR